MTRPRTLLPALILLLALPGAKAAPLDILGTRLDLPFAYDVVDSTSSLGVHGKETYGRQLVALRIRDASGASWKILVAAAWLSAPGMHIALKSGPGEDSPAERGHGSQKTTVRIDGRDFVFADERLDDATYPRVVRWEGTVDTLGYQIAIGMPEGFPMSDPLIESVRSIHVDRDALETNKSAVEAEVAGAVEGNRLHTPLGELATRNDIDIRFALIGASTTRDASGSVTFRRRSFGYSGPGGYLAADDRLPSGYRLDVGCGKLGALGDDDAGRYIAMRDGLDLKDPKRRFTKLATVPAEPLFGLPTQSASADMGSSERMVVRAGRAQRWVAKNGDEWFMVGVAHLNTRPVEGAFLRQLAGGPAVCHYDLAGAAGVPATATAR